MCGKRRVTRGLGDKGLAERRQTLSPRKRGRMQRILLNHAFPQRLKHRTPGLIKSPFCERYIKEIYIVLIDKSDMNFRTFEF